MRARHWAAPPVCSHSTCRGVWCCRVRAVVRLGRLACTGTHPLTCPGLHTCHMWGSTPAHDHFVACTHSASCTVRLGAMQASRIPSAPVCHLLTAPCAAAALPKLASRRTRRCQEMPWRCPQVAQQQPLPPPTCAARRCRYVSHMPLAGWGPVQCALVPKGQARATSSASCHPAAAAWHARPPGQRDKASPPCSSANLSVPPTGRAGV